MATITVNAHEVEGVRSFVDWELSSECVFPEARDKWRAAHERIGWLLGLDDALAGGADGQSVEIEDSPFLADFARKAGEFGAEDISIALRGEGKDPEECVRKGKGLISFADRLGVYEGVVV